MTNSPANSAKNLRDLLEHDELPEDERARYLRLFSEGELLLSQWRSSRWMWARELPRMPKPPA